MNRLENTHRYDDIIDLPHPVSKKHPQMPSEDRAAQFSPFAALTGTTTPAIAPVVEDKDAIIEALKAELAASKASKD